MTSTGTTPLRLGLIGYGAWGHHHVAAIAWTRWTIDQVLAGLAHHRRSRWCGRAGAVRATWAGAMDRTREAVATLSLVEGLTGAERFDGPEAVDLPLDRPSGELYELEEEIRRMVASVRSGVPFVSGDEARKAVLVCLAAEASARLGHEVPLAFD